MLREQILTVLIARGKNLFPTSLMLYLYELMDVDYHTYCGNHYHDVGKSNHYAVQLKLIQCYMSIVSQ